MLGFVKLVQGFLLRLKQTLDLAANKKLLKVTKSIMQLGQKCKLIKESEKCRKKCENFANKYFCVHLLFQLNFSVGRTVGTAEPWY